MSESGAKVLVVDDDHEICNVLKNFLELKGYITDIAFDGKDALRKTENETFDLVVTDIKMPEVDGITLTRELMRLYPDTSVMVMTGFSDEYYEQDALAAGASDFVKKPFGLNEFWLRLQKLERDHGEKLSLKALAHGDALTGLPNRKLFQDRLAQALEYARRYHHLFALLYLDLDHFKEINDTLGHEAGDQVLKESAARLKGCIRKSDTVARLGGDEFTIILAHVSEEKEAEFVAKRVVSLLSEEHVIAGRTCAVTVSVGIALYPAHGEYAEDLLKKADEAMYKAKQTGKNGYCFCDG